MLFSFLKMAIKISDNSIRSLRNYFREKLKGYYEKEEIDDFFFRAVNHYFGLGKTDFFTRPESKVSESDILVIRHLANELKQYKPLQYIFGKTEFYGLEIEVNPSVLIPRPETEEMVVAIVEKLMYNPPGRIIDLCTGSGCIALALKKQFPAAQVTGMDMFSGAVETARRNAENLSLDVQFHEDDLLHPDLSYSSYGLIVSNPPYVTLSEKPGMQANVTEYEPHTALFVPDNDPLLYYRAIVRFAVDNLMPGGWLFTEINEKFGEEISKLMKKAGIFENISTGIDLQHKPRWVCAQRIT